MFHVNSTVTWLLLDDHTWRLLEIINGAVLCNTVALFGVVACIINMIVFCKQGFNTPMNISLFSLALSDLGGVVTIMWVSLCKTPLFRNAGVPLMVNEFNYLTGVWPHFWFARVTCWLTAYITAERCMCIVLPLKNKLLMTPKRTAFAMVFIYVTALVLQIPQYVTAYIDWKFYPEKNMTLLGLVFINNKSLLGGLGFMLNSANGLLSFTAVIIFTAVLVVKLGEQRAWHEVSLPDTQFSKAICNKERKTMAMVLLISSVLIVCYFPGIVTSMLSFVEPQFSVDGLYSHFFFASWSFCTFLETVNSSVTIFLYYKISTRYRQVFREVFFICKKKPT